jgi:transcriptional regulator with XRE-family HTH domain
VPGTAEALLEEGMEDAVLEVAPAEETEGAGVTSEQAEEAIEAKRIGDRIKFLRQRKQMGLVELGRHTGLSASFLSQLETGRVVPTLRNLARIAMVFSKDMSYFFEPEKPELFRVVRSAERQRLPQTGADEPGYFFEPLGAVPMDKRITPYIAEFLPASEGRTPRSHQHPGTEFLYILSGTLKVAHDSKEDAFEEGDALYFQSSVLHSYECVGDCPCEALIITMPEPAHGTHTGSKVLSGKGKSREANA